MAEKNKVFELPFSSTSLVRDPVLLTRQGNLLIELHFDDEGRRASYLISFSKQRAFRKRSEIYCTSWHVVDAFDTVCEIEHSDWVEELRLEAVPEWRDQWVMNHFMIYIDSFGCVEVIAEMATLESLSDS